jgi:hypothetical protein
MTREVLELPFPCIAMFGTEENCVIMLIMSRDSKKCAVFRGNLKNEPELRAELFNGKHPAIHWNESSNKPETIN